MRDYAKVCPKAWHGQTMKALRKRGSKALLVGLYLMTSPSSNMLGIFTQPVLYMAHEAGLGEEGALEGLRACIEEGFCSYDRDSEVVWVHEMAKYQIAESLKASDLRCKGIQKEYDALPDNPFLEAFFDHYSAAFHMTRRRPIQGATKGPSKGDSKPLRSQEQEQEQEQEQDSSSLRSEEGANKSRPTSSRKTAKVTLATYLEACKAIRQKPLPSNHSIRGYCSDVGITDEMLQVAWVLFREHYTTDEKGRRKLYADWPGVFAKAVKGRWQKLWYVAEDGSMAWTSTGLQEKAALDARHRAREQQHEPA